MRKKDLKSRGDFVSSCTSKDWQHECAAPGTDWSEKESVLYIYHFLTVLWSQVVLSTSMISNYDHFVYLLKKRIQRFLHLLFQKTSALPKSWAYPAIEHVQQAKKLGQNLHQLTWWEGKLHFGDTGWNTKILCTSPLPKIELHSCDLIVLPDDSSFSFTLCDVIFLFGRSSSGLMQSGCELINTLRAAIRGLFLASGDCWSGHCFCRWCRLELCYPVDDIVWQRSMHIERWCCWRLLYPSPDAHM